MTIAYLTRAIHFAASHRYYRPDWSDEENQRRFGAACWPDGHGHNYRCEVTVRAALDPATGMAMDLAELDGVLDEEVLQRFHNRYINSAVPEFAPGAMLPTTENLAAFILDKLSRRLPRGVVVHRVRVQEDRDLWSDVYGASSEG
ncbi:MAG: 6-carboxytetrahydropterin synthase [Gemmatimonadota bacterium]|nr:MAG: 6-carboxytetrahydropterin synthase [Gemmatimonadota bacterium]